MVKRFFSLYIFFLDFLLTESSIPELGKLPNIHCLVYVQSFNDFVNLVKPTDVIHASCKYCIMYKSNRIMDDKKSNNSEVDKILPVKGKSSSVVFGCLGEGYDESLILTKSPVISINECNQENQSSDNWLICKEKICCCRSFDCYDRLKSKALLDMTVNQGQKCLIERRLLNKDNPIMQKEYDSYAYMNNHCSICGLILKESYFETLCIDENDVEMSCKKFKKFVGGKLACNEDGSNCCCRGKDVSCNEDFRNYAFKKTKELGKPLINSPYTKSTNILLFNWLWILFIFNICSIFY
uniref:Uncharacterized protein n=1 Tax=Strongyloides venezuelensis TaxID=75913 RepID=A0A0K0FKF9_STRVS